MIKIGYWHKHKTIILSMLTTQTGGEITSCYDTEKRYAHSLTDKCTLRVEQQGGGGRALAHQPQTLRRHVGHVALKLA